MMSSGWPFPITNSKSPNLERSFIWLHILYSIKGLGHMCWRLLKSSGGERLIVGKPRTYNPFMPGVPINSSLTPAFLEVTTVAGGPWCLAGSGLSGVPCLFSRRGKIKVLPSRAQRSGAKVGARSPITVQQQAKPVIWGKTFKPSTLQFCIYRVETRTSLTSWLRMLGF